MPSEQVGAELFVANPVMAPAPFSRTALRELSVLATLLCSTVAWVEVHLLGTLYIAELALLACALWFPMALRAVRGSEFARRFWTFVGWSLVYMAVLAFTDLYRGRLPGDYLRGWARAIVFVINTLGLVTLAVLRPRHLRYAVVGAFLGLAIMTYAKAGLAPGSWKFGIGPSLTIAAFTIIDARRVKLGTAVALVFCILHLLLDYRSVAAFCLCIAVFHQFVHYRSIGRKFVAWLVPAVLAVGAGAAFVYIYASGASILPPASDIATRREGSNVERLAGFAVAYQSIREDPIIGKGSWARSEDLLVQWANLQEEMGAERSASTLIGGALSEQEQDIIRTHSQILQAWVEAGIVGFLYFGFLYVQLVRMFALVIFRGPLRREFLLIAFQAMWAFWGIPFSPFAGMERLTLALSIALLLSFAPARADGRWLSDMRAVLSWRPT